MTYNGVIKSFNAQKGYGFIECAETFKQFSKDMFVLRTALPGLAANRGDEVSFSVTMEANGPVATDVQFTNRLPTPGAYAVAVGTNGMHSGGDAGGFYVGTVKSFNAEKGWGLISCQATEQQYGKDIFFGRAVLLGNFVNVGAQVRFSIKMEDKGPAAASLDVLGGKGGGYGGGKGAGGFGPGPAAFGAAAFGAGFKGAGGKGAGGFSPAAFAPQAAWPASPAFAQAAASWLPAMNLLGAAFQQPPKMPNTNQTYFGVLKNLNEEKGWGHISCNACTKVYGKDVFLVPGALQGQNVQVGALLSFKVAMSGKGPQATQVSVLPPKSFSVDGEEGTAFIGTVKSYNPDKGWGFLEGEDLKHIFGKDIFIHKRELVGHELNNGDQIQFYVELDEAGQPVAKKASLVGSGEFEPERSHIAGANRSSPY